jgi:hypothetical protein
MRTGRLVSPREISKKCLFPWWISTKYVDILIFSYTLWKFLMMLLYGPLYSLVVVVWVQKKRKRSAPTAQGSQDGQRVRGVTRSDSGPGTVAAGARKVSGSSQQYIYTPLWMANTYMADGGSRNQLNLYGVCE